MENQMLVNKKIIKKNRTIRKNIKESRKLFNHKRKDIGKFYFTNNFVKEELILKPQEKDLIELLDSYEFKGCSGNDTLTSLKIKAIKNYQGRKKLIVNGIECDPSLIHDSLLAKYCMKEIKEGIKFLKEYLNIEDAYIALKKIDEENYADETCKTAYLDYFYPLGEEHILINELLNMEIDTKTYPTEKGVIVLNIQTVYQIYKIVNGAYDNSRYVTIADLNKAIVKAVKISYNTSIMDTLKKVLDYNGEDVYAGTGALNCHKMENETFMKDTNFVAISSFPQITVKKCIGCGKCTRNCPRDIDVCKVIKELSKDINADISMYNVEKCIHCGLCAYNCGAGMNINDMLKKRA